MKILTLLLFAVFFFVPSLLPAQDDVVDALTGRDPLAGETTGMGQAVEPIIKSPVPGFLSPKPPVQAAPYPVQGSQYYHDPVKEKGTFYSPDVRFNGIYKMPDLTGEGKVKKTPVPPVPSEQAPSSRPR